MNLLEHIFIDAETIRQYQEDIVMLARNTFEDKAEEFIQYFDNLAPHLNFDNPEYEHFYWRPENMTKILSILAKDIDQFMNNL